VELPVCAGRGSVWVDGVEAPTAAGPLVVAIGATSAQASHEVVVLVAVSGYEHRVACGARPRAGATAESRERLTSFTFESRHARAGGGRAALYVPPHHDMTKPSALLVGLHPWNGSIWTYAAYVELLDEARARDVVLLMPDGLGNSLYTADAEDEVLTAMDALGRALAIDPQRVSLWGASMGGAGATTVGFHHPDRFATVTSFFGDSKYDLGTYVKSILHDEAGAHLVNALDVVDNARLVPVWLVHGECDRVSSIAQSVMLVRAMTQRGLTVHFDRVPDAGHEGTLVARFARDVVDRAATALAPVVATRVRYRSVHAPDAGAYGVRLTRSGAGDAVVDLERREDGVHVMRAEGVTSITLARGAMGAAPDQTPPILLEAGVTGHVSARWDTVPRPGAR